MSLPSDSASSSLSRRDVLRWMGTAGAMACVGGATSRANVAVAGGPATLQPFVLPPLGFPFAALEPHLDARTMEIHHGRHHKAYVDNANRALQDHPELRSWSAEMLMEKLSSTPVSLQAALSNNVGGHLNHSLFWQLLTPGGARAPGPELAAALKTAFGSVDAFKDQLVDAGLKRFGSGWAWLVYQGSQLKILSTANQDSPLSLQAFPIIGIDVWEHAYYLAYQNRRADYLRAFWNVLNWSAVDRQYSLARR